MRKTKSSRTKSRKSSHVAVRDRNKFGGGEGHSPDILRGGQPVDAAAFESSTTDVIPASIPQAGLQLVIDSVTTSILGDLKLIVATTMKELLRQQTEEESQFAPSSSTQAPKPVDTMESGYRHRTDPSKLSIHTPLRMGMNPIELELWFDAFERTASATRLDYSVWSVAVVRNSEADVDFTEPMRYSNNTLSYEKLRDRYLAENQPADPFKWIHAAKENVPEDTQQSIQSLAGYVRSGSMVSRRVALRLARPELIIEDNELRDIFIRNLHDDVRGPITTLDLLGVKSFAEIRTLALNMDLTLRRQQPVGSKLL